MVLLLLALTWGSSFILMKRGLYTIDGHPVFEANQVAAIRLSLAALLLSPISIPALRHLKKEDWKWLAVVGLVGSGLPAFLFTNSQKHLDSSIAGILNALTPLFTLLIAIFIFKKNISKKQFAGVSIGLLGAIGLVSLKGFGDTENWMFSLLIVLATFSYGLSVNTVANKLTHLKSLHITSISLLFAGVPCAFYTLNNGTLEVLQQHPNGWSSFGYICLLAAAGTAMANMLYFWLTQQTSAILASSVTYLMPVVAVLWGVYDHEPLQWGHILFSGVILSGVWLVNKKD